MNLVAVFCCIVGFLPAFHFQVPGFGVLNSIGQTPYPPSSFFPDELWGVNSGFSNKWPNGIIPYTFDFTSSNPDDRITLSISYNKLYFKVFPLLQHLILSFVCYIAPELAAVQTSLLQGLMNVTCLQFVPRTDETDYITYRFSTGYIKKL